MRPLRLAQYDTTWPERYEAEARRVRAALDNVTAMEHVGSTSVPGLSGKPTIDIAAAVPTLTLHARAKRQMKTIGYSYAGPLGLPQHVFRKGSGVPWEFIVHVVEHDGQMWRDLLRFRDHLRASPEEAERYAKLKESLLRGRAGWYRGVDKAAFIEPILKG